MQENRNEHTKVFASRVLRNLQVIIPNEREHITILTTISTNRDSISNYHIFKGKRTRYRYIFPCEDDATIGMSKKGWMDTHFFSLRIDHFLNFIRKKEISHLFKGTLCSWMGINLISI